MGWIWLLLAAAVSVGGEDPEYPPSAVGDVPISSLKPRLIEIDVTGTEGGVASPIQSIVDMLADNRCADAAYEIGDFCRNTGLNYREHFEQGCPMKVVEEALRLAGGLEVTTGASDAVKGMLVYCEGAQIRSDGDGTKTPMERIAEVRLGEERKAASAASCLVLLYTIN